MVELHAMVFLVQIVEQERTKKNNISKSKQLFASLHSGSACETEPPQDDFLDDKTRRSSG